MAAPISALVSPTSMYSNNCPPSSSTGWQTPPSSLESGLISPPELRRTFNNHPEPPPPIQTGGQQRQSLPSIHEALSSGHRTNNPYASPVSASISQSQYPPPYSHVIVPTIHRSYPPDQPLHVAHAKYESPSHQSYPQSNHFQSSQSIPTSYPESARQGSLMISQTASYPTSHYERYDQDSTAPERLPPGSRPPPALPMAHVFIAGTPENGSFPVEPALYTQARFADDAAPGYRKEQERKPERRNGRPESPPIAAKIYTSLSVWDFQQNLEVISKESIKIREWSSHYLNIAREQQRQWPDRMPSLDECEAMVQFHDNVGNSLKLMKDMLVTQQDRRIEEQRDRDLHGKGSRPYDEEMAMYEDGMDGHGYGGPESKKRRGRAAPPGRCHSCNRAETPEWRRGPDGARTLCNACGLHYAKLTRKNNIKLSQGSNGSSLRPKSMDDHSPRPM
ncbi:sexual development transcription factor NsdD [Calycina marina]|uniref:Sexual development transcription factor NsdD n=1 Tax=Calycina marina TaxID=1763456 RepID=A0A9P7Z2Q3_9HELO|nr:sexual development transcription factor NsdD [Calycina marina]